MNRRAAVLGATVVAALGLAACGSGTVEVAPVRVAESLAPPAVAADLKLHENRSEETLAAFARAGERSLVSDGRVWEIRRADRLIGTLQISTVMPAVDLASERVRSTIVRQIIPGAQTRIRIDGVELYTTVVNDKAVFVWFGEGLYEVLQLKDRRLDGKYEDVAAAVIRHQVTTPAWKPLPDVLEDDSA